mgnify:FL=1
MEDDHKYWMRIRQFVQEEFGLPGNTWDILFMIGIRELGYGFTQLDQETKTKVFNFVSIYLMKFMDHEQRLQIQNNTDDLTEVEEKIYRQAIIHYFKSKQILI